MKHVPITRAELVSLINENRATKLKVKEAIVVSEIFLAALERKEQEMLAKYEQLERIDALIEKLKRQVDALILLNLRGRVFAIESRYLLSDALWCSYFPVMLLNTPDIKLKEYFIDCTSEGFDRILDCARAGAVDYKALDDFEMSSIERNLGYLRFPRRYRRSDYRLIASCDQYDGNYIKDVLQLRDGRIVTVTGSESGVIRFWNPTTFNCEQTLPSQAVVLCLLQLEDGRLCCGGYSPSSLVSICSINIWDIDAGVIVRTLTGHTGSIRRLAQLLDGRLCSVECLGNAAILRVWDVTSGECLRSVVAHSRGIYEMIRLLSGQVATASKDTTIKIWDPVSLDCVRTIATGQAVNRILEIESGIIASSQTLNGTAIKCKLAIKFWDVDSGSLLRSIHGDKRAQMLVKLQDGRLCGCTNTAVKIWNIETGTLEQIVHTFPEEEVYPDTTLLLQMQDGRIITSNLLLKVWSNDAC